MANEQINIFDIICDKEFKITKPIRLIEFFAGYGSQALALKYLGVKFQHWKIAEWAINSIQAYKDIHFPKDNFNYSSELSDDEVIQELVRLGVSKDYSTPATIQQIKNTDYRRVYNNIVACNNLVSVCNVHSSNLNLIDRDKFTYLLTYSFPCQDLSNAGKKLGCKKNSNTRSGLLWEVERILNECNGNLPDILLMENVPDLINFRNKKDFQQWELKLQSLGYSNYVKILNGVDYGIPQNRRRVFMISILGNYNYKFPNTIKLEKKLKDLLEDTVDKKYYLSDKQIKEISAWKAYQKPFEEMEKTNKRNISPTITTRSCDYTAGMILIKNATKQGYLEASDGDGIDISSRMKPHRGTVQKDKSQTLTTSCDIGVVINQPHVIGGIGNLTSKQSIRKLTPKECSRLMGVKDDDFERMAEHQSEASLYHLFGDSIIVNVLMAIFKQLL